MVNLRTFFGNVKRVGIFSGTRRINTKYRFKVLKVKGKGER